MLDKSAARAMATPGTNIRIATPDDADALLGIYRYYVEQTAVTFEIETPTAADFSNRIERTLKRYPWIVAEQDGTLLGYAYAGAFKQRAAYDRSVEVSVYLDRTQRGRGLGSALYERLEELLRAQGVLNANACITYTEADDDPYLTRASVLFHERLGYRQVGIFHDCGFKFGRWYSMTWMEKMLGPHVPDPAPFIPFPELDGTQAALA